jgi:hypothetical protein
VVLVGLSEGAIPWKRKPPEDDKLIKSDKIH